MPDYPSTTRFLNEDEKILAAQRLLHDGLANTQGSSEHQGHWEAVRATFKDWRVWLLVINYMLLTGSQTIG